MMDQIEAIGAAIHQESLAMRREQWTREDIAQRKEVQRQLVLVVNDAELNGWRLEHIEEARRLLGIPEDEERR